MIAVWRNPTKVKSCSSARHSALQPGSFEGENEGFASEEAGRIYDGIFFFTDASTLQLSDEKLIAELKKDNPDWFE